MTNWQMLKIWKQIKYSWNFSWFPRAVWKEEQHSDTWHSKQCSGLWPWINCDIFLGIDIELREMEDYHRTDKSNNGSKKTVVRITIRRYWKQALLNQNCLEKNNYSKHWFGNKKFDFLLMNTVINSTQNADIYRYILSI